MTEQIGIQIGRAVAVILDEPALIELAELEHLKLTAQARQLRACLDASFEVAFEMLKEQRERHHAH